MKDLDARKNAALAEYADAESKRLPPLLLAARRVASSFSPGAHGRRRPGQGEEFWQFRLARQGDAHRSLDWRRSARSDRLYVREKEAQTTHSLLIWVDTSRSMSYFSGMHPPKVHCASVSALALALLAVRGEEKVGLMNDGARPAAGQRQVESMACFLSERGGNEEFGIPPSIHHAGGTRHVLISDFLAPWYKIESKLRKAAGTECALLQVLDPCELQFPFAGRTVFTTSGGSFEYETFQARSIRDGYLGALEARQARLSALAASLGWHFARHITSKSYAPTLLWLLGALERTG